MGDPVPPLFRSHDYDSAREASAELRSNGTRIELFVAGAARLDGDVIERLLTA